MRCGCTPAAPGPSSAGFHHRILPLDRMCGPAAKGRGERLSERKTLSLEHSLNLQAAARRRTSPTKTCERQPEDRAGRRRGVYRFRARGSTTRGVIRLYSRDWVARTPVFRVRGSSFANTENLKTDTGPRVRERESQEEPQTSKAEVCATLTPVAPPPPRWRVARWRVYWRSPSPVSNPACRSRGRATPAPGKSFLCAAPTAWEVRNRACA